MTLVPEYYESIPYVGVIVTSLVLALFTYFYYTPGWSYRAKWDMANVFAAPISLILGVMVSYGMTEFTDANYVTATLFAVSATTVSYMFCQTLITDVVARKVDRFSMKLAQGITFTVAGVYYLYHSNALLTMNPWLSGIILVVFIVLWQMTNQFEIGTTKNTVFRIGRNIVAAGGILYAAYHITQSAEFEVWFWILFMFLSVVLIVFAKNIGGGDSRAILLGMTAGVPVAGVIPTLLAFIAYSVLTTMFAMTAMVRKKKTTVQALTAAGDVKMAAAPMINGVYLTLILLATADVVFDWQVFQGIF